MSTEINATQHQEQALQRANSHRQRHGQGAQHSAPTAFADMLAQADSPALAASDLTEDTTVAASEAASQPQDRAKHKRAIADQAEEPTDPDRTTTSTDALPGDRTSAATILDNAAQALDQVPGLPANASTVAQLVHAALAQGTAPSTAKKEAATPTATSDGVTTTASASALSAIDLTPEPNPSTDATTTADTAGTPRAPTAPRRGQGSGLLNTQELQQSHTHTAPGKLVSAVAHDPDRTQPPPQVLSQSIQVTNDTPTSSWHMLTPGQPGSALQPTDSTTNSTLPAVITEPVPVTTTAGQGGHGSPSDNNGSNLAAATPDNLQSQSDASNSDGQPANSFVQNLDQAMDSLGAQVSYWSSHNIRRATVRLDIGSKDPLEVDVRLKDGIAQVDFRTNDAVAREAIKSQAPSVLADLLARSGIGLEGLSVGQQGSGQTGQQAYGQADANPWTPLSRSQAASPELTAAPGSATSRITNSTRALDVFA